MKTIVAGSALLFLTAAAGLVQGQQAAQSQPRGTISGVVLDVSSGNVQRGAKVTVVDGQAAAESDMDGLYSIEVPAGRYDLHVSHVGFIDLKIQNVRVKAGEITYQDVALNSVNASLGSVTVVAEAETASEVALLSERKNAAVVTDNIGAQEISKTPGSDAADVMARVTGVSIVDGKYVYVRGLGERYSSTMLNGAIIPTTQPDKRVVPLDLFPSSLLENIRTEKTYSPDQPGEFSAGLVKLETSDFPRKAMLKLSFQQGFHSNTTFKDFSTYRGGAHDWIGFDNGTRSLPALIPSQRVVPFSPFTKRGFTPEQIESFGQAFPNVWDPAVKQAPPNQSFNLFAGNTFGELGLAFSLAHANQFENQAERQNIYTVSSGQLDPLAFHRRGPFGGL
ncbi:MAG: carboxypeptidase regulatory-like domain-containing protein [Acidobacteriota bacterium]